MDMKNLIHMANQIGGFFEAMPNREEATLGIATHLRNFWAPRMRKQLLEYVDTGENQNLKPIVLNAINTHRSKIFSQL